jgi:hypothetical protein
MYELGGWYIGLRALLQEPNPPRNAQRVATEQQLEEHIPVWDEGSFTLLHLPGYGLETFLMQEKRGQILNPDKEGKQLRAE